MSIPDTINTLSIDLTESHGTINSGTLSDAQNAITLCYVGPANGGGELLSYQTATLISPNHYDLGTLLMRALYGSTDQTWAVDSSFLRVDQSVFRYTFPPSMVGKTVYFKFTSFNVWGGGQENIADVPAYAFTITSPTDANIVAVTNNEQPGWTG